MVTELFLLERLSDGDLALIAEAAGEAGGPAERAARLRRRPADIDRLLGRPEVFAALFDERDEDPLIRLGPFAAFAVLVAHVPEALRDLAFVPERVGRRSTVPVFEVEPLRELVADPLRRLFLADLLASYTHVASGAVWLKGRRGWRRRRFSELDPVQIGELILSVPAHERLVLYRRLGDLALFLSGVFPDHAESHPLPPIAVERLQRALAGSDAQPALDMPGAPGSALGALGQLESVGRRSYGLAWAATAHPDLGFAPALGYAAEHFRHARMVLNFVTDAYLFRFRQRWFPLGDA